MVKEKHWPFKIYPIQFIALGFAVIILFGSVLLTLPIYSNICNLCNGVNNIDNKRTLEYGRTVDHFKHD